MNSVHSLFLNAVAPTIVETLERPARAARFADAPSPYDKGDMAVWIRTMTGQGRLWHHQAIALSALEEGFNVVLATSTASGKSLPFMARAIRLLKENPQARDHRLLPAKGSGQRPADAVGKRTRTGRFRTKPGCRAHRRHGNERT